MSLQPTVGEQVALAETRERIADRMSRRERLGTAMLGSLFLLATAGLWIVSPPGHVDLVRGGCALVVLVLATRVRFETPFGFTAATQLGFVPLLFALPAALVPIFCAAGLAICALADVFAGRINPARLLTSLPNACFALGPAWVLALAGERRLEALVLLVALLAQFLGDFLASSFDQLLVHGVGLREQFGDTWIYAVDAALSGVGLLTAEQMLRFAPAVFLVVPLLALLAVFARERASRLDGMIELNETYRGTALLLGDVVEADDTYTGMHSQGVVELALAVGDALGLDADRRRNLEFAALLHDVGKISIPKSIINKPGKLTDEEFTIVKTHAAEGERMLARVGGFMTDVGAIVRSHHERWDGGGYPDGRRGEASPLEARIITACDSWSAMRTDRPYRRALTHADAVAEIRTHTGGQFDPAVAAALLAVVEAASSDPAPTPGPGADVPAVTAGVAAADGVPLVASF